MNADKNSEDRAASSITKLPVMNQTDLKHSSQNNVCM